MDSDAGLRYSSDGHAADRPNALGTFKADKFERFGRQKPSGDGGTDMDTVLTKGSTTSHSTAPVARLLVVGLCVGFCQKGLGVTF